MTSTIDADEAETDADEAEESSPSGVDAYLPNRREAIFMAGGAVLGGLLGAGVVHRFSGSSVVMDRNDAATLTTKQAQEQLEQGNARFVAGTLQRPDQTLTRRGAIAAEQHPFAAVLSCADSRVPPEVLFDQGLGDLFVVRSAGQVMDDVILGSLQYGVDHLKVPLLVVLGHSDCGAVKATIEAIESKAKPSGTDVDDLITALTPVVEQAEKLDGGDSDQLLDTAVGLNVDNLVETLKQNTLIKESVVRRSLKVVGAVYDVTTGEVDWL